MDTNRKPKTLVGALDQSSPEYTRMFKSLYNHTKIQPKNCSRNVAHIHIESSTRPLHHSIPQVRNDWTVHHKSNKVNLDEAPLTSTMKWYTKNIVPIKLTSQHAQGVGVAVAIPASTAHCAEHAPIAALHAVAAESVNGAAIHDRKPAEAVVTVPATMPAAE